MTALPRIRLDRTRLAAPQVLEKLRGAILSLELVPGAVLVRQELADRFGVSQTPVREALLRLAEEGLVDVFPQHATLVSRIDVDAAKQAHFLRRSIELEIVHQLAEEAPPELVAQLQAQVALQATLAAARQYGDFVGADRKFHHLMYEAAGVPSLWDMVSASRATWTACAACTCPPPARPRRSCATTAPSCAPLQSTTARRRRRRCASTSPAR